MSNKARVLVTVDNNPPANVCPPQGVVCDTFDIMGDGKVLKTLKINTDTFSIERMFVMARRRARRIEGATSIRHGAGIYTI